MGAARRRCTDSVQDCCNFETLRRTAASVCGGLRSLRKSDDLKKWDESV